MAETIPFSVGVISAFNPLGKKTTPDANHKAHTMLRDELDGMRLKYVERDGSYLGKPEKHLLIRNISRRELVRLADQYRQAAVLYGEKEGEKYVFDWIEDGETRRSKKTAARWPVKLPRFKNG
jgi:hypothetical protein